MGYEEKYNAALERAKERYSACSASALLEYIFPDIKESEDKKIKESIKKVLANVDLNRLGIKYSFYEMIAWLEKQSDKIVDCQQNHQDVNHPNGGIVMEDFSGGEGFYKLHLDYLNKKQIEEVEEMVRTWNKETNASNENIINCIGMCLTDANEQRFKDYGTNLKDCLVWLERQGEQKAVNKVEPKFHPGDWITNGQLTCKVLRSIGKSYELHLYNDDYCHFETDVQSVDEDYHLWTIADAKDGDVLVASDGSIFLFAGVDDCACKYYAAFATDNYVNINKDPEDGYWETSRAVYPATKEQRDLFSKKMADAGYEWNTEKKEL